MVTLKLARFFFFFFVLFVFFDITINRFELKTFLMILRYIETCNEDFVSENFAFEVVAVPEPTSNK